MDDITVHCTTNLKINMSVLRSEKKKDTKMTCLSIKLNFADVSLQIRFSYFYIKNKQIKLSVQKNHTAKEKV